MRGAFVRAAARRPLAWSRRRYNAAVELPSKRRFLPLWLVIVIASGACDKETTPPEPRPGAAYRLTRETPFHDSGCEQSANGTLRPNTRFVLIAAREGCWNIKLRDEDETYIVPAHVRVE